jgi:hypothetical protein
MLQHVLAKIIPDPGLIPDRRRCIPRGQRSPACSAIVQQFTRGSPASRPRTNDAIRLRGSTRANRAPTRSM